MQRIQSKLYSACVLALGLTLSSASNKVALGELAWFSDEASNGHAFFDYGTVSYMQCTFGFTTAGTLAQRELYGCNKNRENEAFTVNQSGIGGRVLDATIIDFP